LNAADKLGAYRTVTREAAKSRWLTGVPEDKKADLIPPGWFETWADATFATDPKGAKQSPPMLRAPNGVVRDGREFWSAGKALYDPGEIRVATFLVHAEWDADLPSYMLYEYFAKLTNAVSRGPALSGRRFRAKPVRPRGRLKRECMEAINPPLTLPRNLRPTPARRPLGRMPIWNPTMQSVAGTRGTHQCGSQAAGAG
jgi:hypothetical protein